MDVESVLRVRPGRTEPQPRANFDRIARLYRWAEYLALGPLLRRTREHFLPQLAGVRQATLLGDGDGRFAAALLRRNPEVHLRAIDSSRAMLRLLENRCRRAGHGSRLCTEHGVAPDLDLRPGCDLIVTHFFLDCLSQAEVDGLAGRFGDECRPGCRWLLSDFGLPRARLSRLLAAVYIRLLYAAFRLLTRLPVSTLPHPQSALAGAGFQRLARAERLGGFLYTELWMKS